MTFLYRYVVNVLGEEPAKNGDLSIFQDAGKISNYAKEAMAWGAARASWKATATARWVPRILSPGPRWPSS